MCAYTHTHTHTRTHTHTATHNLHTKRELWNAAIWNYVKQILLLMLFYNWWEITRSKYKIIRLMCVFKCDTHAYRKYTHAHKKHMRIRPRTRIQTKHAFKHIQTHLKKTVCLTCERTHKTILLYALMFFDKFYRVIVFFVCHKNCCFAKIVSFNNIF